MLSPTNQLSTREAAKKIGISLSTLNNSRHTGILTGVKAPPFRKLGKKVLYCEAKLDDWLSQFEDQTSTSPAEKDL